MINPLDLKPMIDAVKTDVYLARQAEIATLNYEYLLEIESGQGYDDEVSSPEIDDILERITWLSNLETWLEMYGQNLQRWHR